ncbi:Rox3 mediator complex subunit-domain-containing protein [Kalaharituber pfeilii]|nr:Rox3 mediator complex subunit-domain-containing protein [Kalaharituber pfeilii]
MSRDHAGTKPTAINDKMPLHNSIGSSPTINQSFSSRQSLNSANTIPTPSSSAAGTVPPTTAHEMEGILDEDMMDASGEYGLKNGKRRGSISAEEQHDIYRNHDRGTGVKRSRSVDNEDNEAMIDAPAVPSLKDILAQADVHPLHLLCQRCGYPSFPASKKTSAYTSTSFQPLYPNPTRNIFPLYGLTSIADSVARFDASGQKKKLRKSYKGKILDLPGKNEIPKAKPVPVEGEGADNAPPVNKNRSMGLLEMLDWPDEEWNAQKVVGKEISQTLPQDALRRALTMSTGPIPGFDTSILGLDEKKATLAPKSIQTPSASVATPHAQLPNGSTPGGNVSSASVSPASRPPRTSRAKRRKYEDSSFEGYGEGYDDDDAEDYGDEAKKKRKRKKVNDRLFYVHWSFHTGSDRS